MTKKWQTIRFFSPLVVFGVYLALSQSALAYQHPGQQPPPTSAHGRTAPGAKANETYCVIQIGEDIKVASSSETNNLKKKAKDDFKADLKKYNDDKKDKKNHDANLKKPEEKDYVVKVLKLGFKAQEDAQKFADDKIKERDKGPEKKTTASNNNW